MYHQGTTISVKKLNVKIVGELSIKLPDMRKQQIIGELYQQFLMRNYLMMKQVDDIRRLTLTMIRKIEED